MARKPKKKRDGEVSSLIGANITQATGWLGGEVSGERARNLNYYYGRSLSHDDSSDAEVEDGQSRWISTDVQNTIEAMMPDLMEIFASSDQIFAYEPTAAPHEEFSEQATDYINYVIWNDNPGYEIIHDFFKDALLQKNGYVKAQWNKTPQIEQETLSGVSSPVLAVYENNPQIEIIAVEAQTAPPGSEQLYPDGLMWDITLKREYEGRIEISGVGPEYMLTSRFTKSMDSKILFACDFQDVPRSDLIEDGYDEKIVNKLPTTSSDQPRATREGFARWQDEDNYGTGWTDNSGGARDRAMEQVRIFDCYLLMDYLGTGVAQRYNVKVGGQGESPTLLPDPDTGMVAIEVDDHPYVDMTPIRMPHKMIGRAVADLVVDIQDIKSTGGREMLNEMYYANNVRSAISNKVNIDDWLTNRPGDAVRVDTDAADVGGHIQPIPTHNGVGQVAMPLMQYMDERLRERTGANQDAALDPHALHQTATGANLMLGERQKRVLFIARTCAETGMRNLASKLLQIAVNNQDFERVVQLRGKWVSVRPDRWNANMNVSITVGLGHGTRAQKVMGIDQIQQRQAALVEQQGGQPTGPYVMPQHISNGLEEFVNAHGYRDANMFFNVDVENMPPPQDKGPDPAMLIAQAQLKTAEAETMKAQADLLGAQNDRLKIMAEAEGDKAKLMLQGMQGEAKLITDSAGRTEDQRQHDENLSFKYAELASKENVAVEKVLSDSEKAETQLNMEIFKSIGWGSTAGTA